MRWSHRRALQCHDTNRCLWDPTQHADSAPAAVVDGGFAVAAVDRSLLLVVVADAADVAAVVVGECTTEDCRPVRQFVVVLVAVAEAGSAASGDDTSRWCSAGLHCRGNCSICP